MKSSSPIEDKLEIFEPVGSPTPLKMGAERVRTTSLVVPDE
jgi:hypothetical protein